MSKHLNQFNQNADFLRNQCQNCKDRFFDWKVTCCFYVAYHAVQALAHQKGVNIGTQHHEICKCLNPDIKYGELSLNRHAWACYRDLKNESITSRYNGFDDVNDHENQNRENLTNAFKLMNEVIKYCNKRGLNVQPIPEPETIGLLANN